MEKEMKRYGYNETDVDVVVEPAATYNITRRYSYADYLTWFDDKRRELIDGIVRLTPSELRIHADVSMRISFELMMYIDENKSKSHVYFGLFDVRLPKNGETADNEIFTVVQPDICVVCDLSKLDDAGCLGAPEVMIEILSPLTEIYDLNIKFHAYRMAGVREYWVVDIKRSSITVFQLQSDGNYDVGTIYNSGDKVTSSILPGLEIDLQKLFFEL